MDLPTINETPPPVMLWTNGKLEQVPRTRSVYDEFGEVERFLRLTVATKDLAEVLLYGTAAAGKLLALKERVCAGLPDGGGNSVGAALSQGERGNAAAYRAHVFGRANVELWAGVVRAESLQEAESFALAKAALELRVGPAELCVRHLHELCPACGQEIREGVA